MKDETEEKVCPHCGALMVDYPFNFNKGILRVMLELYRVGGEGELKSLRLTYPQRTNAHKMRYWELAEPVLNEESYHKRGWWRLTEKGVDFIEGRVLIPKKAWTRRNVVIGFDGPHIGPSDADPGYTHYREYAEIAAAQIRGEA